MCIKRVYSFLYMFSGKKKPFLFKEKSIEGGVQLWVTHQDSNLHCFSKQAFHFESKEETFLQLEIRFHWKTLLMSPVFSTLCYATHIYKQAFHFESSC